MCGQMKSERPWTVDPLSPFGEFMRVDSPFDREYNHSYWWAIQQLERGRRVRKQDMPRGQYLFLLNQSGDLNGNSWQVDSTDFKKLTARPFKPTIMLADADDSICGPLDDLENLGVDNWGIYE